MKNINDYKKRFYNLMESTIGNVKPLINESDINIINAITTALQGVATYYNAQLTNYYTKNPKKPKVYFSVTKTAGAKDAEGTERDIVWIPYFGTERLLIGDALRFDFILQDGATARPGMQKLINNDIINPIMSKMNKIDGITTRSNEIPSNTAVAAINAALKKAKNPTRPK